MIRYGCKNIRELFSHKVRYGCKNIRYDNDPLLSRKLETRQEPRQDKHETKTRQDKAKTRQDKEGKARQDNPTEQNRRQHSTTQQQDQRRQHNTSQDNTRPGKIRQHKTTLLASWYNHLPLLSCRLIFSRRKKLELCGMTRRSKHGRELQSKQSCLSKEGTAWLSAPYPMRFSFFQKNALTVCKQSSNSSKRMRTKVSTSTIRTVLRQEGGLLASRRSRSITIIGRQEGSSNYNVVDIIISYVSR